MIKICHNKLSELDFINENDFELPGKEETFYQLRSLLALATQGRQTQEENGPNNNFLKLI